MYSVSEDYLTAMSKNVQSGYISGYIGTTPFDADDVLLGSASISNKCVDSNDIKLGGVNIGTLKITFVNTSLVTRGTWEKKEISVYWNQLIDDETQTFETVPVGVFIINEANHAAEGVIVTAYDKMSLLDKELNFTTSSGSIYSFLTLIAEECDFSLGMTRAEIEALPNGEETFSIYPDNDMKTFRNLLAWVAQTCGSFATFDRNGELVLKTFGSTSIMTISSDKRVKGGSFSDFKTFYTAISVVNIAEQTTTVEKKTPDNGLTMNLGANPFLQYGLAETLHRQRTAILESLAGFNYTPFSTSLLGNPIFDLGDVFTFTDGIAGISSKCCLMEFTYIFNRSFSMRGYGKNPALLGAQSKTDKNIQGLNSNIKDKLISYITYTNADEIELNYSDNDGLLDVPVATLYVAPIHDTNLDVNTRIIYSEDFATGNNEEYVKTIKAVRYELDGVVLSRIPFEDNPFCIVDNRLIGQTRNNTIEDFQALLNVQSGDRKTLVVYLEYEIEGTAANQASTITIPQGGVEITLRGQGLPNEEAWSGLIVLDDEIPYINIGFLSIVDLTASVSVALKENEIVPLSDEIEAARISSINVVDILETLNIYMTRPTFNISDESGEYNFVTEDDKNIITE